MRYYGADVCEERPRLDLSSLEPSQSAGALLFEQPGPMKKSIFALPKQRFSDGAISASDRDMACNGVDWRAWGADAGHGGI